MLTYCKHNLESLQLLLKGLDDADYTAPLEYLSDSTIGQHTRHVIEFYQCLLNANDSVNYDARKRNNLLQTDRAKAIEAISVISAALDESEDKDVIVAGNFSISDENTQEFKSTFLRELAYCLDHSIHHQALIKVGMKELNKEHLIPKNFGVAPATIRHLTTCAQ